jgi:hypothetical protein
MEACQVILKERYYLLDKDHNVVAAEGDMFSWGEAITIPERKTEAIHAHAVKLYTRYTSGCWHIAKVCW